MLGALPNGTVGLPFHAGSLNGPLGPHRTLRARAHGTLEKKLLPGAHHRIQTSDLRLRRPRVVCRGGGTVAPFSPVLQVHEITWRRTHRANHRRTRSDLPSLNTAAFSSAEVTRNLHARQRCSRSDTVPPVPRTATFPGRWPFGWQSFHALGALALNGEDLPSRSGLGGVRSGPPARRFASPRRGVATSRASRAGGSRWRRRHSLAAAARPVAGRLDVACRRRTYEQPTTRAIVRGEASRDSCCHGRQCRGTFVQREPAAWLRRRRRGKTD
jgi:hypothetical protein